MTDVEVASGLIEALADEEAGPGGKFVLTDRHVAPLLPQRLMRHPHLVLAPGEARKSWEQLGELLLALDSAGIDRDGSLLAIGGGVVTDLGGLAACLHRRGIAWVAVPTTLVGQIDAAYGGKTAVNHGGGKNTVGAFHAPARLLADPAFLTTLPSRELRAGMAELLKTALIAGEEFTDRVEALSLDDMRKPDAACLAIIRDALSVKGGIVAGDPNDHGVRRQLNLGHTFGHALEAASAPALLHGEAVGLGLLCAARIGSRLKRARPGLELRLKRILEGWGLPVACEVRLEDLRAGLRRDKKRHGGRDVLIALLAPGHIAVLDPAPSGAFDDGLSALAQLPSTS